MAHNLAGREIRCTAAGATPRVVVSQRELSCGPTLPGGKAEATLQVGVAAAGTQGAARGTCQQEPRQAA